MNLLSLILYPLLTLTPGHTCSVHDPDFKEFRYVENIAICKRAVSYERRQKIYDLYDVPKAERKNYTIDHFIPLSLGGSNNDKNLWPQHKSVNTSKCEFKLYQQVKNWQLELSEARDILYHVKVEGKACP